MKTSDCISTDEREDLKRFKSKGVVDEVKGNERGSHSHTFLVTNISAVYLDPMNCTLKHAHIHTHTYTHTHTNTYTHKRTMYTYPTTC